MQYGGNNRYKNIVSEKLCWTDSTLVIDSNGFSWINFSKDLNVILLERYLGEQCEVYRGTTTEFGNARFVFKREKCQWSDIFWGATRDFGNARLFSSLPSKISLSQKFGRFKTWRPIFPYYLVWPNRFFKNYQSGLHWPLPKVLAAEIFPLRKI